MNKELNKFTTVNEQLKMMTADFLSRHSSLTLNALAQRSGVAATTLRRLMQDETNSVMAPHSVLSLVSYLNREKCLSKILKNTEGPVGELLRKCFDQFVFSEEKSNHKMDQSLNDLFNDKTTYLIYKMAANVCGASLEKVKNNFGLMGVNIVDDLMEKGWLFLDEKNRIHAKEKNFSVDLLKAKELTHELVNQYKPSDVERGYNLFYSLSEGLNMAGIKAVKKIELEAVKKVHEIMNNKDFLGEVPYFSIFLSDVIGLTPQSEISREVLQ
jgi:transcriptional regulator with XRE-family HTH domain